MNPIFPSILSGHFYDLETKLNLFSSCGIEAIHLDVMDGHFVPNLSFGPSMVQDIKRIHPFLIDAHLMVSNPIRVVPWFLDVGADWISIHVELTDETNECIDLINRSGTTRSGLVLNPDTPVETVFPYLERVQYVLLMSVFPGYGGQSFIADTLHRIKWLRKEIERQGLSCLIQVDGGINHSNLSEIRNAGADIVVIGSALYGATDITQYCDELLNCFRRQTC